MLSKVAAARGRAPLLFPLWQTCGLISVGSCTWTRYQCHSAGNETEHIKVDSSPVLSHGTDVILLWIMVLLPFWPKCFFFSSTLLSLSSLKMFYSFVLLYLSDWSEYTVSSFIVSAPLHTPRHCETITYRYDLRFLSCTAECHGFISSLVSSIKYDVHVVNYDPI